MSNIVSLQGFIKVENKGDAITIIKVISPLRWRVLEYALEISERHPGIYYPIKTKDFLLELWDVTEEDEWNLDALLDLWEAIYFKNREFSGYHWQDAIEQSARRGEYPAVSRNAYPTKL